MTGDPIQNEHHVARHLNPRRIDRGLPAEHAFDPDDGGEVSVNWLEHFGDEPDQEAQLERVRGALIRKGRTVKRSHRLALLNVGCIKFAVHRALGGDPLLVVEQPERNDPSHAAVVLPRLPADRENATAAIRSVVRPEDMRPALVGSGNIPANPKASGEPAGDAAGRTAP